MSWRAYKEYFEDCGTPPPNANNIEDFFIDESKRRLAQPRPKVPREDVRRVLSEYCVEVRHGRSR